MLSRTVALLAFASAGCVVFGQAPNAPKIRQVAYLKASNPHANDHFGNGGALEGHGLAISGDGGIDVGVVYVVTRE